MECKSSADHPKKIISHLHSNKSFNGEPVMDQEEYRFIMDVAKLIQDSGLLSEYKRSEKVVDFQHPDKLQDVLDLRVGENGADPAELLQMCKDTIAYSVKTSHPYFFNQLYHAMDPYGLAGAWLTESLNTNQYTFEVAPVFTLTELEILKHMLKKIGFQNGDGIFAPGGSISNMYGIVLARYKKFPEAKTKGICSMKPLVLFTSQDSHYSILKSAHWVGVGTDNVVKVDTDDRGRMIPKELEKCVVAAISEGKLPFFVNATAGTTVLGAYDPLRPIADICAKYDLWLHVDGAWGGSAILSREHRELVQGIERVDSIAIDLHKMMGAPLQCAAFLIKEKGLLHRCNSASASYLFQQDKFYDVSYDTGDKSVQCGRKVDGFKLWLMWKARGDRGMEAMVDNAFNCAKYMMEKLETREGFRLVIAESECTNVCFWYIPPRLRGKPETEEWWHQVAQVAPKMKETMILNGSLMIGYQPLTDKGHVNFFRMVIGCFPPCTHKDVDFVIDEIDRIGKVM